MVANAALTFVLQVFFWLAVLAVVTVAFALRTRHRMRNRYHVKLSELSTGLKALDKKGHP